MDSVFRYADYRTFLRDYHDERRRKRGWSSSVWARKLQLKSPSTLNMILRGERRPGPRLIEAFTSYFGFDEREGTHFRNLVLLSRHERNPRVDNAKLPVRRLPPEKREIQRTTFAISAAELPRAEELLRRLRDEFCNAVERRDGDAVYQLEIAFFPARDARG